ncbi:hypothetical protein C7441_105279 [Pseudaminobacter salicylatoxidans]|uniref:Uncharacterized protein n=1 Tax=Pseudaminobacter salicylatoxidans TaxID=93369 RepID=A0A316C4T9_PSESE|nr:hypothetical protein C7441_105279 [Pseudaminobacter salicylatoxidans]
MRIRQLSIGSVSWDSASDKAARLHVESHSRTRRSAISSILLADFMSISSRRIRTSPSMGSQRCKSETLLPGAPYTYIVTKDFLLAFGLDMLRDLSNFEMLRMPDCSARRNTDRDILTIGVCCLWRL